MAKNSISVNQELYKSDYLVSENGKYKAIFQDDGDFVIYTWTPVWQIRTSSLNPFRIVMQEDTNLVMYNENDKAVWRIGTHTANPNRSVRLTLTNEGHLTVRNNGHKVWSSETSQGITGLD